MVSTRSSCSFTFGMRCFRRGTCVSGKCRKSGSLGETEKHPFCPQGIRRDRLQRFDSYASFLNMSDHALCSSIDRWQHYGVICKLAARREKRYDECQQIGQSGRRIYSYSREMTQPRERGRRELESHSLFLSRAVYILAERQHKGESLVNPFRGTSSICICILQGHSDIRFLQLSSTLHDSIRAKRDCGMLASPSLIRLVLQWRIGD
mmetsp:Transcript_95/g.182  ORF Transcript_95/g.182 Transcript_95/m.182 type:complete len:207 (-) Transcript_95:490-1110(-)